MKTLTPFFQIRSAKIEPLEKLTPIYQNMSALTTIQQFQAAIIRMRDILRHDGITGMDSMKHCTLYIASRYLTTERMAHVRIPSTFAWETILALSREGLNDGERSKNRELSRDRIFNASGGDCLVNHFDNLFKTTEFSFRIGAAGHGDIMETLNTIRLEDIELSMDLLGWVYEQHLSKGSAAARDLGQYFTDRSITQYMTRLCDPRRRADGTLEYVCDPSMGTGGFLTSAVQHMRTKHRVNAEELAKSSDRFHGCDIDRFVGAVASINMFMESRGTVFPNIAFRNSLYTDMPIPQYDVILANMPFGVKNLKFADCCERVKVLGLNGTKSEPLFLQLMMVALAPGGRCAVVVPDGMLVNQSKCHDGTRKYLLDHFELKRVLKMEGKFFMNTGIKPSILFFENTGKPTTTVDFWKVVRSEKGEITETLFVSVPRAKMDASCSFDMRRYLESDKPVANPAGFPMVKLGDVFDQGKGKILATANILDNSGEYPIMSGGRNYCGNYNKYNREGNQISISNTGSSSGFIKWHEMPFWASDCTTLKMKELSPYELNLKYVFYVLSLQQNIIYEKYQRPGVMPHCYWKDISNLQFPLPPLPIQDEIVATLDRIYNPGTTDLADTLKRTSQAMDLVLASPGGATLEPIVEAQRLIRKSAQMVLDVKAQMVLDVKAQMVAVVKAICNRCKDWASIGSLYDTPRSEKKFNSKDMNNAGDVPFFNGKFNSPVGTHSEHSFNFEHDYFVMIKDGGGDHSSDSVGMGKFFSVKGKCAITSHNLIITPKAVDAGLHKFMSIYLYCNGKEIRDKAKYSINLGSISVKDILEFPVPNLTSEELVNANIRLSLLQTQLTALESLQKQTEDNARFILDSYLTTKSDSIEDSVADDASADTISHE